MAFREVFHLLRGPCAREMVKRVACDVEDEEAGQSLVAVEEEAEGLAGAGAQTYLADDRVALGDVELVEGSQGEVGAAVRADGQAALAA
ncbi:hypothetical protein ACFQYP_47615 [Nonomuraea antimicrobica]